MDRLNQNQASQGPLTHLNFNFSKANCLSKTNISPTCSSPAAPSPSSSSLQPGGKDQLITSGGGIGLPTPPLA
jgi:hypothetical protein